MNRKGISLLELVVAVVFFVIIVAGIGRTLPNIAKSTILTRHQADASRVNVSLMDKYRGTPYHYIDLGGFGGLTPGPNLNDCDCRQANYDLIAASTITVANGVQFTSKICVTWVQIVDSVQPQTLCNVAGNSDPEAKLVHIRTSWQIGGAVYRSDLESILRP